MRSKHVKVPQRNDIHPIEGGKDPGVVFACGLTHAIWRDRIYWKLLMKGINVGVAVN
jgi:hypothetical protein